MTSTTRERSTAGSANGYGDASARIAELFGEHGAAEVPFAPFIVASEGPVSVTEYRPSPFRALGDAWRYRRVGLAVFWSTMLRRLYGPRLGPTWLFVQSFMAMIGTALIFGGGVFHVKTPGGMPYILYSMVGMMGFQLFMHSMYLSLRGFRSAKLIQDIPLPLLWVPIVGSGTGIFRSLISMTYYVIFIVYFWARSGVLYVQLSPRLLTISAAGFGFLLMFAWGMGMWLAPMYAWAKDTRYVLRLVMPFWMFLTPVLYPPDHLHGVMRVIGEINPLTAPIEMTKVGMLGVGSVSRLSMVTGIPIIVTIFLSGVWFITRFGSVLAGLRDDDRTDDDDDLEDGML